MAEQQIATQATTESSGRSDLFADTAILAVTAIWGSSYVVMQLVVRSGVSVPSFLALRFVIAVLPLLAIIAVRRGRFTALDVKYGLIYGVILFTILFLETTGVQYTSAANAGFLITLSVIIVPVISRVIGRKVQPLSLYVLSAVALVGCGMLTLNTSGLSLRAGDFIILAAALVRAYQIYSFGQKIDQRPIDVGRVTLIELAVVALLGTAIAPLFGSFVWSEAATIDATVWILIAYMGIFGTAYAFAAQLFAARRSSATRVALIMATEPLFAALFAVVVGGESLTTLQLFGGLLIVTSAMLGRVIEGKARAAKP